jgi:hypothetical protein
VTGSRRVRPAREPKMVVRLRPRRTSNSGAGRRCGLPARRDEWHSASALKPDGERRRATTYAGTEEDVSQRSARRRYDRRGGRARRLLTGKGQRRHADWLHDRRTEVLGSGDLRRENGERRAATGTGRNTAAQWLTVGEDDGCIRTSAVGATRFYTGKPAAGRRRQANQCERDTRRQRHRHVGSTQQQFSYFKYTRNQLSRAGKNR